MQTRVSRRTILTGLGALAGAMLLPGCRRAESKMASCTQLSGKKIRWIVPNAVGGGYDTESRLLEPFLEQKLGTELVIENLPGASGKIGAKAIISAKPDGQTLGIISVPAILGSRLTGETEPLNPIDDFSILCRVSRSWQIWAVGSNSPYKSIEDLFKVAEKRPLVFATSEVTGTNFIAASTSAGLMNIPVEFVAGFSGAKNTSLAAVRGEVDFVSFNFDSIQDLIETGDLIPVLQLSQQRISPHKSLEHVPLFGGPQGIAQRRAVQHNQDQARIAEQSDVLINLIGAGRVIVGPPKIAPELLRCLADNCYQTLMAPAVQNNGKFILDVAAADETMANIRQAMNKADLITPLIQQTIKRARQ